MINENPIKSLKKGFTVHPCEERLDWLKFVSQTIGNGAVIGVESVVIRDIDPMTVIAGNPA